MLGLLSSLLVSVSVCRGGRGEAEEEDAASGRETA